MFASSEGNEAPTSTQRCDQVSSVILQTALKYSTLHAVKGESLELYKTKHINSVFLSYCFKNSPTNVLHLNNTVSLAKIFWPIYLLSFVYAEPQCNLGLFKNQHN